MCLTQTIVYPQGGGQPSDMGILQTKDITVHVVHVIHNGEGVKHYIEGKIDSFYIGEAVTCFIDPARSLLNARYHTTAHLIGHCVAMLDPKRKTIRGHSFPNEAFIECEGEHMAIDQDILVHTIHKEIQANSATQVFDIDPVAFESQFYPLPYPVPAHKTFRAIQISDFLPVPCGGTHVARLGEIQAICLKKIKYKENQIRISYALESL